MSCPPFFIDLSNNTFWTRLPEGNYEWQILSDKSFSKIGSFKKPINPKSQEIDLNLFSEQKESIFE